MVKENLEWVRARLAEAAKRADRDPSAVHLVCVTKGVPIERIQEAVAAGVREIGENRVQEALSKEPVIGRGVRWHLIGHLQRNKVKFAVWLFDLIHSVDSTELVSALDRQAAEDREKPLDLLIQVNVSGEATKSGCRSEEVPLLSEAILKSKNLRLAGLMTLAPFDPDPEAARPFFRRLREVRDALEKQSGLTGLGLSMGMSQDFEVAVEEGATWVRIGTTLFGER